MVIQKNKKKATIARSSAKAEYKEAAKATANLVWMKLLLKEIGFPISELMRLWCDNQVVINIANNLVFHEKTKQIEIDCHHIWEKVQKNITSLHHVKIEEQVANIFTKPLSIAQNQMLQSKLCMEVVPSQFKGKC